ncbi:MAG: dTDP-glucose 4,6-dehydratase [Candidatus Daviesbacteria bacterium]|nr:dTDP-glucose 4,6-dehydratase [Candidatus Daviesbacteria bacterium]
MKILVTGGAGFIGSNFVHYWNKSHPEDLIVVLDKLTYAGNLESLKDLEGQENFKFVKGDIVDAPFVDNLFREEKFDTVVHFAAESHVDRSILEPAIFIKTNVMGTQVLLDASLNNNVKRFHHVSTDEVFGAIGEMETRKFNEETAYSPRSPYAASKAGSDHLVRAYSVTYDLPITITNCSNNYGPYHFPEKLIPLAITNLMTDKKIPVYGQGKQSRDWLYVEDHCRAIEAVLLKGKIGETYCVGGMESEEWTNLQVAQEICRIMGKDPEQSIEFVTDRKGHDFKYVVDWSKIKNELGWKPQHEFKEWLEKTVEWYKNNQAWWEPLKKK